MPIIVIGIYLMKVLQTPLFNNNNKSTRNNMDIMPIQSTDFLNKK